jgi:L-threonylcarbamoyladenylate synthase
MLASHYAPRLPVRLNATSLEHGEALLAFGDADIPGAGSAADATGANRIAVMSIPRDGIGEAINDRLTRAAAARD